MWWYLIGSLFSDSRVRFLLGFIVVAIAIAVILIFIEVLLKKKKVRLAEMAIDEAPIYKMREFLEGNGMPKEKLDFVDKTAKGYFGRKYGTPVSVGYSMLIEWFEKNNGKEEVAFCKEMFASYYFDRELTDDRARALGSLFVDIVDKKKRLEKISRLPSFFERVGRFFGGCWEVVKQKRKERVERRRVREAKRVVVVEKKRSLKIVRKRERVIAQQERVALLKKKFELSEKMKMEAKEKIGLGSGRGVASRIVDGAKNRLSVVGVFNV